MLFHDIPGNENIKQRLITMARDERMPHAILLHGLPGIGKMAMARALAQYLHCSNPGETDSCDNCDACRQVKTFNHPDTLYVFPIVKDEKAHMVISEDYMPQMINMLNQNLFMDWEKWVQTFDKKNAQPVIYAQESEELERKLALTSTVSPYKVVIMWLPEKMNETASNKLLKLIEEPLGRTVFILVSDSPQDILPTIRSRCQGIEMTRLNDDEITQILVNTRGLDYDDAKSVAHISGGSVTRAFREIDASSPARVMQDMFMTLMRQAYQQSVAELRDWANTLAGMGRDQEVRFYVYCQRMVRENFFTRLGNRELIYLNKAEAEFASRFSRFIHERNAEKLINVFQNAIIDIQGNANGKIVNLDVAVKVMMLLRK